MSSCQNTAEVKHPVQPTTIIVAAIDIGTVNSGYAFSFRHEYTVNPLTINANVWANPSGGGIRHKVPSCLLLTNDKQLHSFGYEAIAKYEALSLDNKHRDWYFFWQFKMTLHQQREINRSYKVKDVTGKQLDSMTVFSLSINYLKDHAFRTISNSGNNIKPRDIRWVVTVPAIWQESAKKFMRLSAEKAGIDKDRLEIALEPEAASILCRLLPITRDTADTQGMVPYPPGTKYMILDCGGGTVDVTVHEINADKTLKELHVASGGDWGGTKVNKAFLSFLANLVGPPTFNTYEADHNPDYLRIIDEFEKKKSAHTPDSADLVAICIPTTFQGHLKDKKSRFPPGVALVGDKLRIPADKFHSFFKKTVDEILIHVDTLLKTPTCDVSAILMVGGFSESPILQKAMKDKFQSDNRSVIIPVEASMCVVKGAVLYGHDPLKVQSRKCPCTYGVQMTRPFKEGDPSSKKITLDGNDLCDDVFDIHVQKDHDVKVGYTSRERMYTSLTPSDRYLPVALYKSSCRTYPRFVDDRGCEMVGLFIVKLPELKIASRECRKIYVKIQFGGTDISVVARERDGTRHTADFKFEET